MEYLGTKKIIKIPGKMPNKDVIPSGVSKSEDWWWYLKQIFDSLHGGYLSEENENGCT